MYALSILYIESTTSCIPITLQGGYNVGASKGASMRLSIEASRSAYMTLSIKASYGASMRLSIEASKSASVA